MLLIKKKLHFLLFFLYMRHKEISSSPLLSPSPLPLYTYKVCIIHILYVQIYLI